MKVYIKHRNITQNMHGASTNYRYVWDVSHASSWSLEKKHVIDIVIGKKHQIKKTIINKNILWFFRSVTAFHRSHSMPKFLAQLTSVFVTFLGPFWLSIFLSLLTAPTFLKPSVESVLTCQPFYSSREDTWKIQSPLQATETDL